MVPKILCSILTLILLNACQSTASGEIAFEEDETRITLVEEMDLLAIEYTITNKTEQIKGPYYTKILFQNETISNLIGLTESSPYKRIGNKESIINLNNGDSFRSGESFEITGKYLVDDLREIIENSNAIEIQLIDLEDEEPEKAYWIHDFKIKH